MRVRHFAGRGRAEGFGKMQGSRWPKLRLTHALKERLTKEGNLSKLAAHIEMASKLTIDPRKLKRILIGDPTVGITLKDFVALDAYLSPFGEGLADNPLFDSQSLLSALVDRSSVLMLLGSHPQGADRRANLSRWDLRAANKVTRHIHSAAPATGVIIDDVVFARSRPRDPDGQPLPMLDDTATSLCIIGSPRACWAAERALAEMFDVDAFSKPDAELPFHFVWSRDLRNLYRDSTFAFKPNALRRPHPAAFAQFAKGEARALVVGDKLFMRAPTSKGKPWKDYGVVAAQRREDGRVFVVVAGLSGPATFAVAQALASHRIGTLPHAPEGGGHGLVRWALIEATVEDEGGHGDTRNVVGTHVVETFLYPSDP